MTESLKIPGLSGLCVVAVVVLRISAQPAATGCNAATKRNSGKNDIESKLALDGSTMGTDPPSLITIYHHKSLLPFFRLFNRCCNFDNRRRFLHLLHHLLSLHLLWHKSVIVQVLQEQVSLKQNNRFHRRFIFSVLEHCDPSLGLPYKSILQLHSLKH